MAAQSGRSLWSAWTAPMACSWLATGLMLAAAGLTWAQPAGVEQWRGNQRLGTDAPPAPAPVQLQPVPQGDTLPPLRVTDLPPAPPPPFRPDPLPVSAAAPALPAPPAAAVNPWHRQLLQASHEVLHGCEHTAQRCASSVGTSAEQLVDALAGVAEGPGSTVPTTGKPRSSNPEAAPAQPHSSGAAASERAAGEGLLWVQVALLVAVVTGPLAVVAGLALMVRWSGMKFRVEIINTGATGLSDLHLLRAALLPPPAAAPAVAPVPQPQPADIDLGGFPMEPVQRDEEPFTGEFFDLGPSYEEERLQKEEAVRAQEQALVQQIFEENLRLRQDLEEMAPDDALSGDGEPVDE